MTVWIVTGWFGDREWIEGVYATEKGADLAVAQLSRRRDSARVPEFARQANGRLLDGREWNEMPSVRQAVVA